MGVDKTVVLFPGLIDCRMVFVLRISGIFTDYYRRGFHEEYKVLLRTPVAVCVRQRAACGIREVVDVIVCLPVLSTVSLSVNIEVFQTAVIGIVVALGVFEVEMELPVLSLLRRKAEAPLLHLRVIPLSERNAAEACKKCYESLGDIGCGLLYRIEE